MKIKLLKNIGLAGKHTPAGTVVEVSERIGFELVGNGRAELVAEDEAPAEDVKVEEPANGEIVDTLAEEVKPAKKNGK